MSTKSDNRIIAIDYAKVIGIILVVLGHYAWFRSAGGYRLNGEWIVAHFVTLFHMPLFFLISGILYKRVTWRNEVVKVVKSLLTPYLLFSAVGLIVLVCSNGKISRCIVGILTFGDWFGKGATLLTAPMWYCGAIALIRICESFNLKSLRLSCTILGLVFLHVGDILPLRLDSMLVGYLFFLIGETFRERIITLLGSVFKVRFCALLGSVLVLWLCWVLLVDLTVVPNFSINAMRFGKCPIAFLISGVAGTMSVLLLSSFLSMKSRAVMTISSGTIVILGLHQMMLVFAPSLPFVSGFWEMIILTSLIILVCALLTKLFARYAPILIGGRVVRA